MNKFVFGTDKIVVQTPSMVMETSTMVMVHPPFIRISSSKQEYGKIITAIAA
jgi:hypothetical protein